MSTPKIHFLGICLQSAYIVGVESNKKAKLDARIPQELRDLVDDYAKRARLSKGQVVERALFAYFGISVPESPTEPKKSSSDTSSADAAKGVRSNLDSTLIYPRFEIEAERAAENPLGEIPL